MPKPLRQRDLEGGSPVWASDRDQAASDQDRQGSLQDSVASERDQETAVREIDRSRRTKGGFVLAFVDVDRLRQVNDTEGHLAGDRLLADVATALREGLRSYDLIMRYGGDEFVCALSGVHMGEARQRFDDLAKQLADRTGGHSVSVGFAELQDGDDMERLLARADAALLQVRQAR